MTDPAPRSSFTGVARTRKTTLRVKLGDLTARTLITIGGLGTICAVALVCVFLVSKTIPLFTAGSTQEQPVVSVPGSTLRSGTDEYRVIAWQLDRSGQLSTRALADGTLLGQQQLSSATSPSAWTTSNDGSLAVGYADGSVRFGRIASAATFARPEQLPQPLQDLPIGGSAAHQGGIMERLSRDSYRQQTISGSLDDPFQALEGTSILALDAHENGDHRFLAVLGENRQLVLHSLRERTNLMTGKVTLRSKRMDLPALPENFHPQFLGITGLGDNLWVVSQDGRLERYDTRSESPTVVEEIDLCPEDGIEVTHCQFLNGRSTLLVGDSSGRVQAFFRVQAADRGVASEQTPSDNTVLIRGHSLQLSSSPISALAISGLSRLALAGDEAGNIFAFNVTTQKIVAQLRVSGPVDELLLSPKDDALLARAGGQLHHWNLQAPHHDVSASSLVLPVHYESRAFPETIWQSSSGDDAFEPKFGLWPLVFGTLKAAIYALVFGVPIALLAAIYTSEFLHPRAKATIKPAIEMMASLPSVVLGFLAGIVIATVVEDNIAAVLLSMIGVPFCLLLGARLWQLLPRVWVIRLGGWRFVAMLFFAVPCGLWLGQVLAAPVESWLFVVETVSRDSGVVLERSADLKTWLSAASQPGANVFFRSSAAGGWMFLFLPLCALATALINSRLVTPWLKEQGWNERILGCADLVRFLAGCALTVLLAYALSSLLALGLESRGGALDTYVQRNALVVGFIMGFAIIPIIYTIAEDAMSAVPSSLRSASLGCGATPWQTAMRVVLPTAMSGVFSAVMIGLGRAVGETMIVLMAAGNTPVLSWNIFNGFRTLSANIAVELPEAPVDSTHYRTLFLAALVLFAMTFVLNTIAESVRQRFRKRAFEL